MDKHGRLIDADALEREGWSLSRNRQVDYKTMVYEVKKPTEFPTIEPERKTDNFENGLHDMFDHIWDCEIDHPAFQDTVGELMGAVIQLYKTIEPERKVEELLPDGTLHLFTDTDLSKVNRVWVSQNGTHYGDLYYADGEPNCSVKMGGEEHDR